MSDLVRFGVAMDRGLLGEFDRRIAARGYENRSEALRDLIRADLLREAWDAGSNVAATLTTVYPPQAGEAVARITEGAAEAGPHIVSTLRVRLDPARMLDVIVVRGRGVDIAALSGKLGGARGVLSCEVALASATAPREAGDR